MRLIPLRPHGPAAAALALLLSAAPAAAQMTPLADGRYVSAGAACAGVVDGPFALSPPAAFAYWNGYADALAEGPLAGSAAATGWQVSEFFAAGIYGAGSAGGSWNVTSGSYEAASHADFVFRVNQTLRYTLDIDIDPGDGGTGGIRLEHSASPITYESETSGQVTRIGLLSPGTYAIRGHSDVASDLEWVQGPTYSYFLTVQPNTSPLIARSPRDTTLACGNTMTLSVVTTAFATSPAFQWRRNFVPLADGARYAGATSASLSILAACDADTGWYDVVVTQGADAEPSSPAHLGRSGTSDAGPAAGPGEGAAFVLGPPVPNPSARETTFRFAAPRAGALTAGIFDAAGRRVRMLEARAASGAGTLTWDGRDESGARVRGGIYFLRVQAGPDVRQLRFVRLD